MPRHPGDSLPLVLVPLPVQTGAECVYQPGQRVYQLLRVATLAGGVIVRVDGRHHGLQQVQAVRLRGYRPHYPPAQIQITQFEYRQ